LTRHRSLPIVVGRNRRVGQAQQAAVDRDILVHAAEIAGFVVFRQRSTDQLHPLLGDGRRPPMRAERAGVRVPRGAVPADLPEQAPFAVANRGIHFQQRLDLGFQPFQVLDRGRVVYRRLAQAFERRGDPPCQKPQVVQCLGGRDGIDEFLDCRIDDLVAAVGDRPGDGDHLLPKHVVGHHHGAGAGDAMLPPQPGPAHLLPKDRLGGAIAALGLQVEHGGPVPHPLGLLRVRGTEAAGVAGDHGRRRQAAHGILARLRRRPLFVLGTYRSENPVSQGILARR